jgi:hypothetical protein
VRAPLLMHQSFQPQLLATRLEERDGATWVSGRCSFCWQRVAVRQPPPGVAAVALCENHHPFASPTQKRRRASPLPAVLTALRETSASLKRSAFPFERYRRTIEREESVSDVERLVIEREARTSDVQRLAREGEWPFTLAQILVIERKARASEAQALAIERDGCISDIQRLAIERDEALSHVQMARD